MNSKLFMACVLVLFLIPFATSQEVTCRKSDGGWNPYEMGILEVSGEYADEGRDYCVGVIGSKVVREVNCDYPLDSYPVVSRDYECPNGCKDGACILKKSLTCEDTDGGIKFFIAGGIGARDESGNQIGFGDTCMSNTTLKEYYCNEIGEVAFETFECQPDAKGFACYDGACWRHWLYPTEETGPLDMHIDDDRFEGKYTCVGCEINELCYAYGYIEEFDGYCFDDFGFKKGVWGDFINWLKKVILRTKYVPTS